MYVRLCIVYIYIYSYIHTICIDKYNSLANMSAVELVFSIIIYCTNKIICLEIALYITINKYIITLLDEKIALVKYVTLWNYRNQKLNIFLNDLNIY